jgi:hypothetical protein
MQAQLDRLRERYEFPSWSETSRPSSLVWGFQLSGHELPGWRPHRIQLVDMPGDPPASLSVWRPAQGNGALLAVNVYECPSETAAREHLLRLLGEFQGPALTRAAEPGDVAFTAGSTGVLFARGNLVALVRSIERTPAPVTDNAARLDAVLAGTTEPTGDNPPEFSELAASTTTAEPGALITLTVAATDPAGGAVWFLFRCDTADLVLLNNQPALVPDTPGSHAVEVTAIGSSGRATRELRIEAAGTAD